MKLPEFTTTTTTTLPPSRGCLDRSTLSEGTPWSLLAAASYPMKRLPPDGARMEGNPFRERRFNPTRKRGEWARSTSPSPSLMEKHRFWGEAFFFSSAESSASSSPSKDLPNSWETVSRWDPCFRFHGAITLGRGWKGEANSARASLGAVVVGNEGSPSIGQQP